MTAMKLSFDSLRGHFQPDSQVHRYVHYLKHRAQQTLRNVKENSVGAMSTGTEQCEDYSHIYRPKTRRELALLSGAVCGIEFCYAAETAFVSPILLSLGVRMKVMTLFWCLSPLLGFFITPLLGTLSDSCKSKLGRRRPFIILLSIGIVLGLIFVPNGRDIGLALGDHDDSANFTTYNETESNDTKVISEQWDVERHRPWGIAFTAVGVVLLDFCCDACQSPARSYLLDVTIPEDHAKGLSVFTVMGGIGGSIGYAMGAVNWSNTFIGVLLGSQERPVFIFVLIIFLICVITTVTSFKEMPLTVIWKLPSESGNTDSKNYRRFSNDDTDDVPLKPGHPVYGSTDNGQVDVIKMTSLDSLPCSTSPSLEDKKRLSSDASDTIDREKFLPPTSPSVTEYMKSIFSMPKSILILCLTHLFCWMSLVCYSLYFTDFVGEVVFEGDPTLPETDPGFLRYQEGVRFGCWGMACCLLACSAYSYIIERLVRKLGAKTVYIGGQLVYSAGMVVMAAARHKVAVILMSPTTGVMYATLFTMPYLLVAHYHQTGTFAVDQCGKPILSSQIRGMGTDVAVISSMIFLSQFILSICMGSVIAAVGSSVATVCTSVLLSSLGAICASRVLYLDL